MRIANRTTAGGRPRKIGYARVSIRDQTLDLQVDALKKAACFKVLTEVMSGAAAERPVLLNLMNELRAGDVLIIWKLDRWVARSSI